MVKYKKLYFNNERPHKTNPIFAINGFFGGHTDKLSKNKANITQNVKLHDCKINGKFKHYRNLCECRQMIITSIVCTA